MEDDPPLRGGPDSRSSDQCIRLRPTAFLDHMTYVLRCGGVPTLGCLFRAECRGGRSLRFTVAGGGFFLCVCSGVVLFCVGSG